MPNKAYLCCIIKLLYDVYLSAGQIFYSPEKTIFTVFREFNFKRDISLIFFLNNLRIKGFNDLLNTSNF